VSAPRPSIVPVPPPPPTPKRRSAEGELIRVIRKVARAYAGGPLSMRMRSELDEELLVATRRYLLDKRVTAAARA